jgi:hypothetical protein
VRDTFGHVLNQEGFSQPRIAKNYKFGTGESEIASIQLSASIIITPRPRFVIKTRRSDNLKYFINVCEHAMIGYGKMQTSSKFPKKTVDKDGSTSFVYDICLNTNYLGSLLQDESEVADAQREEVTFFNVITTFGL